MFKIKLISVGKTKESWLNHGIESYVNRLSSTIKIQFQWVKDDISLINILDKDSYHKVGLDETGQTFSSNNFATFLYDSLSQHDSRLTLIIGGANGLPKKLKAIPLISLSPMTFTHQMTRLILLEQIYRATEINKNSPYHK